MNKILFIFLFFSAITNATNTFTISGTVTSENGDGIPYASIYLKGTSKGVMTDIDGTFVIESVQKGSYSLIASITGYKAVKKQLIVDQNITINISLEEIELLNEVVITGTQKPVKRLESPIPVEVYSATFLKKNPAPNIFEALQNVNGVRPQINCTVCNTGDIHINGLEGPYTLVLIEVCPL